MKGQQFFDNLKFDDNDIGNQQIHAISDFEFDAVVGHRQRNLPVRSYPDFRKFMNETYLIGTFEKTGSQSGMHLDRASQNNFPKLIFFHTFLRVLGVPLMGVLKRILTRLLR